MKKKFFICVFFVALCLTLFPACDVDTSGSVKSLTHPYVAKYECVEGKIGEHDILEKYDFIRITLLSSDELEVSYKSKKGERHAYRGAYTFDDQTRELKGEIGILGIKYHEKIIIENGKFTIYKNILSKPLILKFEAN